MLLEQSGLDGVGLMLLCHEAAEPGLEAKLQRLQRAPRTGDSAMTSWMAIRQPSHAKYAYEL